MILANFNHIQCRWTWNHRWTLSDTHKTKMNQVSLFLVVRLQPDQPVLVLSLWFWCWGVFLFLLVFGLFFFWLVGRCLFFFVCSLLLFVGGGLSFWFGWVFCLIFVGCGFFCCFFTHSVEISVLWAKKAYPVYIFIGLLYSLTAPLTPWVKV